MSVIDEVKQKTDIVEVIGQYATLRKAGRNLTALCPFHSETKPSFFVYPEQQSWHCFGSCSTGGDVFSFVMKKENMDFGEALRMLAQRAGVEIPSRFGQDVRKDEKDRLLQINEAAADYFHNQLLNAKEAAKAREYLERRGLSAETIEMFRLGYGPTGWESLKQHLTEIGYPEAEILEAGLLVASEDGRTHDRFRGRLMFPISDSRGKVVGFGGRILDDSLEAAKYVNSPQTPLFDKSGIIYALDLAAPAIRQQDRAVLVEGYMDVITAHQHGFRNVVAAMGTAITERQVSILKRLSPNLLLALDADSAGEEAMLRCVGYENTLNTEMKVIILPPGKDPDDTIKKEPETWQRLVDEAVPVLDYTFDMVTSRLDMDTASGQTMAVSRLGPIINEIKDPVRQAHYKQKLARVTDKDLRTIELALGGIMKSAPARPVKPAKLEPRPTGKVSLYPHRVEEECLALMLKHPEIVRIDAGLELEFFEGTENREIFLAVRQAQDPDSVREGLDPAFRDYYDELKNRPLKDTQLELRYNEYVRRLKLEHLRNVERKRAAVLASEAETKGSGADLARLKEEGIEPSTGLREIYSQKARRSKESRR